MSQQPPAPPQGPQQPGWGPPPQGPPPQGWQQGPPPEAKRPWFKKKRIMIPLVLLGLFVFGSALGGGSATDSTNTSNDTATEKPADDAPAAPKAAASEAAAPAPAAPAPAAPAPAAIVTTAKEMIEVLEENALKAKNTYNGKTVTVSGFVGSIDASGKYFSLDPSAEAFVLTGVQVQTGKKFQDQLASFRQDQPVTVTGKITNVGEVLGYSLEAATIQ